MAWLYHQGLHRVLYGTVCLNSAWICRNIPEWPSICLNMTEYCWMSLTIPEHVWRNCSDYARVLNMLHHFRYLITFWICLRYLICWGSENGGYSNNVIIIVTNIIILESLPAGLVHTGTLQLTILSSFNTS